MPDPTPEQVRLKVAADALREYVGRRWVVCDHAQIVNFTGAARAVLTAAQAIPSTEVRRLRAELLAEESRMLDARAFVTPRAKSHLDAAARRLRALADALGGTEGDRG